MFPALSSSSEVAAAAQMRSLLAVGLLWTSADALDNGLGRTPPMGFNTARPVPSAPLVLMGWGVEGGSGACGGGHGWDAGALLPQL